MYRSTQASRRAFPHGGLLVVVGGGRRSCPATGAPWCG